MVVSGVCVLVLIMFCCSVISEVVVILRVCVVLVGLVVLVLEVIVGMGLVVVVLRLLLWNFIRCGVVIVCFILFVIIVFSGCCRLSVCGVWFLCLL